MFRAGTPYEERLRLVAQNWTNSYGTALLDASTTPNLFVLRFEDFLAAPESAVRALCKTVELDFDDSLVPQAGQRIPFATLPGDRKWYPLYPSAPRAGAAVGVGADHLAEMRRPCGAIRIYLRRSERPGWFGGAAGIWSAAVRAN